jgi:uncharacterized protein (DUF1778 family)
MGLERKAYTMVLSNETKNRTINIRVNNHQMRLIDRAAALKSKSRSDFLLEAATRAAEDVILDSSVFTLPAEEWERYIATIESPPAPTAALRKLLQEPSPWE